MYRYSYASTGKSFSAGRLVILLAALICLLGICAAPFGLLRAFATDVNAPMDEPEAVSDGLDSAADNAEASPSETAADPDMLEVPDYDGSGLTIEEIQAEISLLREKLTEYDDLQAALQQKLEENYKEIEAVLENKRLMDEQLLALNDEMAYFDDILAEYDLLLAAKEAEIAEKQVQYDAKYAIFSERLRQAYEEGTPSILEIFFYSDSFIDLLTSMERASDLLSRDKALMDELETEKGRLVAEKAVLEAYQAEKQSVANELEARRILLNNKISESVYYLESLENDNNSYSYYIQQVEASTQIVNGVIDQAVKDYYQRLEEIGETDFFKEKEYKLHVLADSIQEKMENGEIQRGSEYFEDGEEYIWPVSMDYYSLTYYTSKFGYRTYWNGSKYITSNHQGIDIGIHYGDDIYAAKSGTVIAAAYQSGYGYYITVQHEDGTQTRYAHNTKNLVEVGEYVLQGEVIAKAGSTGNATGNCCHFEIHIDSKAVDPAGLLRMPAGN